MQLHLGVESIRAPEILFQPSMVGCIDAGIMETIDFVLKQFTADDQLLLAKNIFLTGGCSNFRGTNTHNAHFSFFGVSIQRLSFCLWICRLERAPAT